MKNLYFIQIAFSYDKRLAYLPYAAGCLAAAVQADAQLAAAYKRMPFIYERLTIDENMKNIIAPDIVAFTNYVWNTEYNKLFAKQIKKKYPACLIIFGGHTDKSVNELFVNGIVDVVMKGEGEVSFPELLKRYENDADFDGIPGVSFMRGGEIITTDTCSNKDLSLFPSPYLTGMFDDIMANNPQTEFHATIETNRGCPYNCAYCEWCYDKHVRQFPMEKVRGEIEWMAEKKIEYCFCADGNFGILKRDVEIARFVVETKKRTGYPRMFKPTYAKNSNDNVFEAGRLLYEAGADKGITLSYQTLNEEALKNIGRDNLDINVFNELSSRYAKYGIPTYSDLILGLPGETYDSFCEGLCRFMEYGQHNSVSYYRCQVYAYSDMGREEYLEKYKITSARVPIDNFHYNSETGGVDEYFDVVISTYSMTREDWEKMNLFGICVEAFHHIGLLRCFALYLRHEKNVPYYEFYRKLLDYLLAHPETFAGGFIAFVNEYIRCPEKQWTFRKDVYGDICWFFDEGCFLECVRNGDIFWKEISQFLSLFGIEEDIFNELLKYQRSIIRVAGVNYTEIESAYDFYNYFNNIYSGEYAKPEKRYNKLCIKTEKDIFTWEEYAREIVWYGKRRGATFLTNSRERLAQTFI